MLCAQKLLLGPKVARRNRGSRLSGCIRIQELFCCIFALQLHRFSQTSSNLKHLGLDSIFRVQCSSLWILQYWYVLILVSLMTLMWDCRPAVHLQQVAWSKKEQTLSSLSCVSWKAHDASAYEPKRSWTYSEPRSLWRILPLLSGWRCWRCIWSSSDHVEIILRSFKHVWSQHILTVSVLHLNHGVEAVSLHLSLVILFSSGFVKSRETVSIVLKRPNTFYNHLQPSTTIYNHLQPSFTM